MMTNAQAAQLIRSLRWPAGPICPHCGNRAPLVANPNYRTHLHYYRCSACRLHFSELTCTALEGSKLPLKTWCLLLSPASRGKTFRTLSDRLGWSRQALARAQARADRCPLCLALTAALKDTISHPPCTPSTHTPTTFLSGTFQRQGVRHDHL
jgi:transposase-like protein